MPSRSECTTAPVDMLRAIAMRVDNERIAVLTPAEQAFAMTLKGRRLLECVRLGGVEFRLSTAAGKLLAEERLTVAQRTDTHQSASQTVK